MTDAWITEPIKAVDKQAYDDALARQSQLTKPAGSLGTLEELACRLAALQGRAAPQVNDVDICLFAADHGIAEEAVSAFPQQVTVQMVANFCNGGAAISVLAKRLNADLQIIDLGTCESPLNLPGVIDRTIARGTMNFHHQQAMTRPQLMQAFGVGKEQAEHSKNKGCDLFVAGEMGIANTSSATAVASLLLDVPLVELVGPGTGLDVEQLQHKQTIIEQALLFHRHEQGVQLTNPLTALCCVGGFEIAAIAASYIRCAQLGVPFLVDGFITNVALLCAEKLAKGTAGWCFIAHASAEPGHIPVLDALGVEPLLRLNMRLGEGSGAAVAIPIMQSACALHNAMATFSEAVVSDRD